MKYAKILGLLAAIVTALMAFAATASATTLTDKTGAANAYEGEIHAVTGKSTFIGVVEVNCDSVGIKGKVKNPGGKNENETVVVELTAMERGMHRQRRGSNLTGHFRNPYR